jgi:hypothetical protein
MMNSGRSRIDEITNERELELQRRESLLEKDVNQLEQSLKISEWLLWCCLPCHEKNSCPPSVNGGGSFVGGAEQPRLWRTGLCTKQKIRPFWSSTPPPAVRWFPGQPIRVHSDRW